MDQMVKWIGGATAAIVLLIGTAVFVNQGLEAQDGGMDRWLTSQDVLGDDPETAQLALDLEPATEPALAAVAPSAAPAPIDLDEPFVIKRILPINGPIRYGEWHWDDEGVPDGPLVMTVDLEARVISVFRNGYEIGAAAVLLGTQEKPTPLGTFPILQKKRHNISSIYNVPMPYTMRLTWDGIAIHSSEVENGYASRGCIGTPDEFAAKLFAIAGVGDKVIITRGQRAGIGSSIRPG